MRRAGIVISLFFTLAGAFLYYCWSPAPLPEGLASFGVYEWGWMRPRPDPAAPLRVVTYNIGYASDQKNNQGDVLSRRESEANLVAIADSLVRLRPDIVGLQEVDFASARSHQMDQMTYIARTLRLPYAAYVVTWNHRYVPWPYWPPARQFGQIVSGQVVLSRYPIRAHRVTTFPKPQNNPFWYNWFYLDRVAQYLEIDVDGRSMAVWHTHLEAFDEETRKAQAGLLVAAIRSDAHPWQIVLGDLNSVSHQRPGAIVEASGGALRILMEGARLRNAESPTPTYSFSSWDPIKKIDHILYREPLQVVREGVLAESAVGSDHLPVWAHFQF